MDKAEVIIYQSDNNSSILEVRVENETVWLSQSQMTSLFNATKQNISLHIHNIFKEGVLQRNSVVKEYLTTASDGKPEQQFIHHQFQVRSNWILNGSMHNTLR